jgi:hypothetical protein
VHSYERPRQLAAVRAAVRVAGVVHGAQLRPHSERHTAATIGGWLSPQARKENAEHPTIAPCLSTSSAMPCTPHSLSCVGPSVSVVVTGVAAEMLASTSTVTATPCRRMCPNSSLMRPANRHIVVTEERFCQHQSTTSASCQRTPEWCRNALRRSRASALPLQQFCRQRTQAHVCETAQAHGLDANCASTRP